LNNTAVKKQRFDYIDQFRGFVGILMLVGHSSYYLNSIWNHLDPFDPLFPNWSQFALRYAGYLCAPGFLMMSGAMVWWSYHRRVAKGIPDMEARWHVIQRGLFLVLLQMTWVNSSWGGFSSFNPWHLGIIATIGLSMILLTTIIKLKWEIRLVIALGVLILHPFLLEINYNHQVTWESVLMQTFVDSGKFNKYPILPWFALATLGSVMATGWLKAWKTDLSRIKWSFLISFSAFAVAIIIRLGRDWGNLFTYGDFGSFSFFLDQKYPPSLYISLMSFAAVVAIVGSFIVFGKLIPKLIVVFTIVGKVPLFFYITHLAIMGIVIKRFGFFYREGGVVESLLGAAIMMIIMIPLCIWFYRIKKRSNNYIISLM
jgi:uncharacterized membrane protein